MQIFNSFDWFKMFVNLNKEEVTLLFQESLLETIHICLNKNYK